MSMGLEAIAPRETDIPGVHKYCDDWCEFCQAKDRCTCRRVRDAWEARRLGDPAFDADDLTAFTREVAAATGETTAAMDAQLAGDPQREYQPTAGDEGLLRLAKQYTAASSFLLVICGWQPPPTTVFGRPPGPLDVLAWFHVFLAARAHRALVAAARGDRGIAGEGAEAEGSAKIALISIDRSLEALARLTDRRQHGHHPPLPACSRRTASSASRHSGRGKAAHVRAAYHPALAGMRQPALISRAGALPDAAGLRRSYEAVGSISAPPQRAGPGQGHGSHAFRRTGIGSLFAATTDGGGL